MRTHTFLPSDERPTLREIEAVRADGHLALRDEPFTGAAYMGAGERELTVRLILDDAEQYRHAAAVLRSADDVEGARVKSALAHYAEHLAYRLANGEQNRRQRP